jgi:hypothetical protein
MVTSIVRWGNAVIESTPCALAPPRHTDAYDTVRNSEGDGQNHAAIDLALWVRSTPGSANRSSQRPMFSCCLPRFEVNSVGKSVPIARRCQAPQAPPSTRIRDMNLKPVRPRRFELHVALTPGTSTVQSARRAFPRAVPRPMQLLVVGIADSLIAANVFAK